jgi:hypothetical protein
VSDPKKTFEVPAISDELISFLVDQGHGLERAQQIAGNHPDAVRAEMEKANVEKKAAPKKKSGATETAKPDTSAE